MKKMWPYRLFVGLFLAILAAPALGTVLLGPSGLVANETPVPPPRLLDAQGGLDGGFFSDAGDWFAKHFAFRKELITADSMWKAALLGTSAQSQVALGKDGWLYYAETLDDYTGADNITPRQAYCAAHSLRMVQDWVEGQGAAFVCTVAPNKISLYPEHYARLPRAEQTAADKLAQALEDEGVAYADLFAAFSGAGEVLYHKTDSHWTNKGAALGHDAILAALGLEGGAYGKPGHYEEAHAGDLYAMLYPASGKLDGQFVFDSPLDFSYTRPFHAVDDILIETAGKGEGTLLMFRDSFGNALHSLMAESFGESTFTRATPYDLSGAAQADYVVLEIVERNIPRLAEGGYLMPAPEVEVIGDIPEQGEPVYASSQAEPGLPGYVRFTGALPEGCDGDSPVCLEAAGTYYEAFPTAGEEDGFTAVLPEYAFVLSAVYWKDGGAVRQPVVVE